MLRQEGRPELGLAFNMASVSHSDISTYGTRSSRPISTDNAPVAVLLQIDFGFTMTERGENAPRQRLRKETGSGCPSKLLRVHMRGMVKPFDVNSS